jgi:hypothetical protein
MRHAGIEPASLAFSAVRSVAGFVKTRGGFYLGSQYSTIKLMTPDFIKIINFINILYFENL